MPVKTIISQKFVCTMCGHESGRHDYVVEHRTWYQGQGWSETVYLCENKFNCRERIIAKSMEAQLKEGRWQEMNDND